MRIQTTNPRLKKLIEDLEKEEGIWKAVAKELDRPNRERAEVNLHKLEKEMKDGEIAVVPGKVLGYGQLNKEITVAAMKFSGEAEEKIKESGSKTLTIEKLREEEPEKEKMKIIK